LHIHGDNVILPIFISSTHLPALSLVLLLGIVILMLILGMIVIYHSTIMVHIQSKRLALEMLVIAQQTHAALLFAAKKLAIEEDLIHVDG
jgi:hypothetical protein